MKFVATSIVALFATVAMATGTTPAGTTTATPAAPAAPAAKEMKAATKETKTAAKAEAKKEDCSKMTGEAKMKCEAGHAKQ